MCPSVSVESSDVLHAASGGRLGSQVLYGRRSDIAAG